MSTRRERALRKPRCRNCGEVGAAHFVPPSFGDRGFYICERPEACEHEQVSRVDYLPGRGIFWKCDRCNHEFIPRSESPEPPPDRSWVATRPSAGGGS